MRIKTGPWNDGSEAEFEPFIDEKLGIAGFKCFVNGETSYVYLNPSSGGDSPDLFLYEGRHGDPKEDTALRFVGFPEPGPPKLTDEDIKHLRAEFENYTNAGDWDSGYYDVMTSIGYVALWSDGDVRYRGKTIFNIGDE